MAKAKTKGIKRLLSAFWYALSGSIILLFWLLVIGSIGFIVAVVLENQTAYDILFSSVVRSDYMDTILIILGLPVVIFFGARFFSYYHSKPDIQKETAHKERIVKRLQKTAVASEVSKSVV